MAVNVYEYGRGGKCVCTLRTTYAGIRIINMQIEKEDRHMRRVMRITRLPYQSMEFAEKAEREQKGGHEYEIELQPRSARNTGRKTGREESVHKRHRLIETGKQTRNGLGGD